MKKKSARKAAARFKDQVQEITTFLDAVKTSNLSADHITWSHDYAVIRLYRAFEVMVLNCLVAAINNDTAHLSTTTGIKFPKHLTDEVCEYIIIGDGYFDFRGRPGLIDTLKGFLPDSHYLVKIAKDQSYKVALERLAALRNFAAHGSSSSKAAALRAIGNQNLSSSGAWLKKQARFRDLVSALSRLADDIAKTAPF